MDIILGHSQNKLSKFKRINTDRNSLVNIISDTMFYGFVNRKVIFLYKLLVLLIYRI